MCANKIKLSTKHLDIYCKVKLLKKIMVDEDDKGSDPNISKKHP